MDELMESLTLRQTGRLAKRVPMILYGSDYWHEVLNLEKMVEWGTISEKDLKMLRFSDSVDDAFEYLTSALSEVEQGSWNPYPHSGPGEE